MTICVSFRVSLGVVAAPDGSRVDVDEDRAEHGERGQRPQVTLGQVRGGEKDSLVDGVGGVRLGGDQGCPASALHHIGCDDAHLD